LPTIPTRGKTTISLENPITTTTKQSSRSSPGSGSSGSRGSTSVTPVHTTSKTLSSYYREKGGINPYIQYCIKNKGALCEHEDILLVVDYCETIYNQNDEDMSREMFAENGHKHGWKPMSKSDFADFKFIMPLKLVKIIVRGNVLDFIAKCQDINLKLHRFHVC
jgi:hypothetical protein